MTQPPLNFDAPFQFDASDAESATKDMGIIYLTPLAIWVHNLLIGGCV